ncbi:MAG: prepilin peptidase [Victivallales bacterium]|jgi:leader peptidase (prepilin peptidase)/N-methyltransferase
MDSANQISASIIPLFNVFVFIIGACIGSFLNVCIWRIPRDESIISPPSHCPKCDHLIPWHENIPLVSWLALRAKCHKCRTSISPRYFLVELMTGCVFLLIWMKILAVGQPVTFVFPYFFVAALVILTAFIDAEHSIIPNEITYAGMVAGLCFSVIWPELWVQHRNWIMPERLISFIISSGSLIVSVVFMSLIAIGGRYMFKKEALGWGDVKYIGAVAALIGIPACFFSLLFASLTGSAYGLSLIMLGKGKLKSAFPLGPFLAAGTLIWVFFGEIIFESYFQLSNLIALKVSGGW